MSHGLVTSQMGEPGEITSSGTDPSVRHGKKSACSIVHRCGASSLCASYNGTLRNPSNLWGHLRFKQWSFLVRMPGEMARVMAAQWTSDQQEVVLEVPSEENGKNTVDSAKSTWRDLLKEMEDSGVTDTTINSHECFAPMASAVDQGGVSWHHMASLLTMIPWYPMISND